MTEAMKQSKGKGHIGEQVAEIVYFAVAAFLLLLLATRSSFLYVCNDWDDTNSYFTMGKAMMNGMVPYRDVFDQKGIFLYFFYGISYLISNDTHLGVFIMEMIQGAAAMYAFYRIMRLYVSKWTSFVLAPWAYATMISSFAFYKGGSAEEMIFPFLAWGLYMILRYFKEDYAVGKTMSARELLIGGILAGMVANIKFIDLGFYFAWMMCIFFAFLTLKDWKGSIKACLLFLGGMALPFVPWLIYFAIHKSLYWWYYATIYINVFVYSNIDGEGPSLGTRIYELAKLFINLARKDAGFFLFLIPGVAWYLLGKGRKILERFTMLALCFFLYVGIYFGGMTLPYYAIPLAIFTVMGFVVLGSIVEWIGGKIAAKWMEQKLEASNCLLKKNVWGTIGCVVSIGLAMLFIWNTSMNIAVISMAKEDHFLFQLKPYVTKEHPTMLNYGSFDCGLDTICHALPGGYWFQSQTLDIEDEIREEQCQYMLQGIPDYLVCCREYPEEALVHYEVVAEGYSTEFNGTHQKYILMKRKDI